MSDDATPSRAQLPPNVLDQIDRICDRFEAVWAARWATAGRGLRQRTSSGLSPGAAPRPAGGGA